MSFRNFFFYSISAIIYLIAFSMDRSLAIKDAFAKVGLPYNLSYGGRFKYLTYITLTFQAFYFSLCTFNSLYEYLSKTKHEKIRTLCNFLYTSVVWPAGAQVTITFWALFFVNRDLIYPKPIEEAIPHWQNHVMHTLPLLTGIFDSILTRHTYNSSFSKGVLPTMIFALAYLAWTFIIAFHGGFWVYPVLRYLSTFYRALFLSGLLIFISVLYKLGEVLNSFFWPRKRLVVKRVD